MPRRFDHDRLRRLRNDLGLSQESLALLSGLEQQSLSRYETGARAPNGAALVELCRALSTVAARAGHAPVRSEDLYVSDVPTDEVDGWQIATAKRG